MSQNQSVAEKIETHLRKSGRTGSVGPSRVISSGGEGGGGAPAAPPPAFPSAAAPPPTQAPNEIPTNQSSKKSGNQPGRQPRVNPSNSNFHTAHETVLNGAVSSHAPSEGLASKSAKSNSLKKISRAVPKAPIVQSTASALEGESAPFLQFGTISPGIVKGMQVPPRTCSAPPNLDEQKSDQVRHESLRAVPPQPTLSAVKPLPLQPMPQQKRQTKQGVSQAEIRDTHSPPHTKRDMIHASTSITPTTTPARSSVLPLGGVPVHHLPFQRPQIPMQFSGPSMQMQPHGIAPTSFQMSMALSSGNVPQVPQSMFVPSMQSHPMQPQAIIHHGQNLGFTHQLGHQIPLQLNSMGLGITPQFPQQQPGKFISQRKAVKITHPDTHEELKLDRTVLLTESGTSGQRQLQNDTSQSSSLPSFNHPINMYSPVYNHSPMFFPCPTIPLTSTQMSTGPQATIYNYPVGQNGQPISFTDSSHFDPAFGGRPGPMPPSHGLLAVNTEGSSFSMPLAPPAQASVKPVGLLPSEKAGTSSVRISMPVAKKESSKLIKLSGDVPGAPQHMDKEVGKENIGLAQKQNCKPLVICSFSSENDTNCSAPSSSTHGNGSEGIFSVQSPLSDASTAVVTEKDDGKEEASMVSESMHDQILCEMVLKQSQQLTDDLGEPSISYDSADSLSSTTNLPLINRESRILEADKKKDTVGGSDSFRFSLEKEPSQDTGSSVSDPVEVSDGGLPFVETCQIQASASSNSVVDRISRMSDPSDKCETLEAGEEHESFSGAECVSNEAYDGKEHESSSGTECVSNEACDGTLLSSSSASSSIGCLDETTRILNQELETRSSEKKKDFVLSGTNNSLVASPEEGESNISAIMRTAVSTNLTSIFSDSNSAELVPSDQGPINFNKGVVSNPTLNKCEILYSEDSSAREPCILLSEMASIPSISSEINEKPEMKSAELRNEVPTPSVLSGVLLELNKSRNNKRKKKEIYSKADAAGCSDPYSAYKPTEEKLEAVSFLETIESSSTAKSNVDSAKASNSVIIEVDQKDQPKAECDNWEVAADTSTPKLRTSENGVADPVEKKIHVAYKDETIVKKTYSREFLLSYSDNCKHLPYGFEVGSDLVSIMKKDNSNDFTESSGRTTDRSLGPSRGHRRMGAIIDDSRRNKFSAPRMDYIHEIPSTNFRPAQGVNNGVRNPSMHPTNQFSSGILSGPMHSLSSQGGIGRNNSDLERWQRPNGTQRGIMAPPLGPMHVSANRYEIGRASDEEEKKQRRLKAILNKLTPQNFEKLLGQVKEVNIDNTVTLTGVISQIFDKALMEPTFCEMYADFCLHLNTELPDFCEENVKITFRRLLLNKCQEEFERGEREQAEADRVEEEGEIQQTEGEREEKRIQARRRMLGNIRFIGELYKKKMLTDRIMHECMKTLLGKYENPDEENIEALCKLMSTIGEMIDHLDAKKHMDAYFDIIAMLSTNQKLSSRVRFMLKDTIDLRKNKWRQRRKVEGPKKIEDVHRDAAQERQAQTSKMGRGPSLPSRRGLDYIHRGSTVLNSTCSQMSGGVRGLPGNARSSGRQDARLDDRHQFESKVLSVPLPHRPTHDGSVTLGPQGGLAKGMSGRGQGLISSTPLAEISPRIGNSHRMASGSNGFGSTPTDRIPSISREENMPKYGACGPSGETNVQKNFQGTRGSHIVDHAPDRAPIATSGRRPGSSCGKITASSDPKALSESTLREKSLSAIREFYSAKDEKEIVRCIRDLNTPGYYPAMVSLWVTDSFEMKSVERSLLAQLLVNLTKGRDSLINRAQLVEGFESVLFTLEDAVNDAPKAGEFLGHIFGRAVVENVVQLMEIGRLIHEGGEAPGTLVEAGLGSEILGSLLEFVQTEKGDVFLNDIRASSKLRFDEFKPPNPSSNSKRLNAFL